MFLRSARQKKKTEHDGLEMIKKIAFLGLVTVFFLILRVEASEFLPLSHWSYTAVDKLGAYGLIDLQKLGTKPYRREDVAKWTEEAIRRIQNREVRIESGKYDLEAILLKLKKEFLDQSPVCLLNLVETIA